MLARIYISFSMWTGGAAMPTLRQKTLHVVPAPLIEVVPLVPETANPTVEFTCGNCGAVLMRTDEEKVHPLVVLCSACGAHNSTDV
jgi:predicted RNA-binding Zn-ribbon protein involved in translation (DUF1610 family)